MENTIEMKREVTEFDFEVESDEEKGTRTSEAKKKLEFTASKHTHLYAKIASGLTMAVALLLVPFITVSAMAIIVLFAEIYLLDWTYSRYSLLQDANSFYYRYNGKSPENEIDQRVARTQLTDALKR